jgi:hypothetical protein
MNISWQTNETSNKKSEFHIAIGIEIGMAP